MEHEKIKLPKFMCKWVDELTATGTGLMVSTDCYPLMAVADTYKLRGEADHAIQDWLGKADNQWKLIDALRYGYEPEPEPRWGIKHKGAYLHNLIKTEKPSQLATYFNFDDDIFSAYTGSRKIVEEQRDYLGFGEVVDLNKEGKADD